MNLLGDLIHIKECYENLICILDNFDCSRYTIYFGHEILSHINLKTDLVKKNNIFDYVLFQKEIHEESINYDDDN